jgi:hypothetical protein
MQDAAYIAFVFTAAVLGALLGIGAHFWRAHATTYAEKLFDDSDIANGLFMDNYMAEKYIVGAEWDDAGFWAPDSVRNLLYYMISGFVLPLFFGLAFWAQRAELVAAICSLLARAGMYSPLC